jgi:DNA-binding NarL/FixJ family response regulator
MVEVREVNGMIRLGAVKKHLRSVVSKLGVSDRTQATVRALELGVLAERE